MKSMATLYREFILDRRGIWQAIVAFIRKNYEAAVDSGKPLHIIVTTSDKKRTNQQNARLWGYVYKTISDQAWDNNRQFSDMVWHEYYANKYMPRVEMILPGGEIMSRRKSTSELNVGEFTEYMQAVEVDAATEYGVVFE